MRRAVLRMAMCLVIAAPLLVGQTPPAPPATPTPAPAPKVRPRVAVRSYRLVAQGRAFLGIEPSDLTPERVSALKLKSDKGVEITSVDQDAPAGKAGLKEHDVILTFNGTPVEDSDALRKLIRDAQPEKTMPLVISRDGRQMTINVTLADRNKMYGGLPPMPPMPRIHVMPAIPEIEMPSIVMQFVGRNGVVVESLTPQLGDFFGVKNGEGVLVRSVEKGSPGEAAGIKAGDVIVRVGNDRVVDTGDWRALIRTHQGQTVQLGIIRDRREMSLSLAIPARRQSGVPSSSKFDGWRWDFDVDTLNRELERIGPEMDRAAKVDMAQLQKELELHRAEMERASKIDMQALQRALEKARKQSLEQIRPQMELWQREMDNTRKLNMEQYRKQMENLQREMEQLRKDLRRQFQEIDYKQ